MRSKSGLEVEFASDHPRDGVVERLENQGLDAVVEEYNHTVRDHWKVTTDSSCGYELVSPPLPPESAKSISAAMRAVTEAGGYVNDSCGFHVHIEVPRGQRSVAACLPIAEMYHQAYEFISPLFEDARVNNRFAMFVENHDEWMQRITHNRYSAVNFQALDRQPTVEFRQHQGTLSPKRAYSWMVVCDTMTTVALEGGNLDQFIRHLRYSAPDEVVRDLVDRGVAL